ncbi:MAG: dihydroorotase [Gammaproteobacteria bacterium AqS3]|nr:dihydroorotase [Gammaproteobacteria bacterium AqS3]
MGHRTLLLNGTLTSDGRTWQADLLIENGRIERIDADLSSQQADDIVDLAGMRLLPGLIDDQVHFREPGWEHKANIASESAAAVAGGITSYMEMPNTMPPTDNLDALHDKYARAAGRSRANYAFHFGATNDNADVIARLTHRDCAGVKVFMGASTGTLLVDDDDALEAIFSVAQRVVLTHCEDNQTIQANRAELERTGKTLAPADHPRIRTREACLKSSSKAVELARRLGTHLHVLHLTTLDEMALFAAGPIADKHITAEVCVHHLWFCDDDYARLGNRLVCNPAVKTEADRSALHTALIEDVIDVIATDHAPHTAEEKDGDYASAPAGLPLVQHSLLLLLELQGAGVLSLEQLVHKACHAAAERFGVVDRGYLREGCWADLVAVDPNGATDGGAGLLSQCGWSPFAGHTFGHRIRGTWVNGVRVWDGERLLPEKPAGMRLEFNPLNR